MHPLKRLHGLLSLLVLGLPLLAPRTSAADAKTAPPKQALPTTAKPEAPREAFPVGIPLEDGQAAYKVPPLPDLVDPAPYKARRKRLMEALPDAPTVLLGMRRRRLPDPPLNQGEGPWLEKNFLYFTGLAEPGGALVLMPYRRERREVLLLPRERLAHYRERKDRRLDGFDGVLPLEEAGELLQAAFGALGEKKAVHGIVSELKQDAPLARLTREHLGAGEMRVEPLAKAIVAARAVKDDLEVRLLERACAITANGFLEVLRRGRDGVEERELAQQVRRTFEQHGGTGLGFSPSVAAGLNSTKVHHLDPVGRLKAGEVLLLDLGAEVEGYTADITRTIPVSGKWSEAQRGLYNHVYQAQLEGLKRVKPGATLPEIHAAVQARLAPWRMPHAVGHFVGLYAHDVGDLRAKLQPGMVITIEPGLYMKEHGLGVRIEDTVLVTEDGARILSPHIPKDPDAIERLIARLR